jgi:serine/threonine protein kinase
MVTKLMPVTVSLVLNILFATPLLGGVRPIDPDAFFPEPVSQEFYIAPAPMRPKTRNTRIAPTDIPKFVVEPAAAAEPASTLQQPRAWNPAGTAKQIDWRIKDTLGRGGFGTVYLVQGTHRGNNQDMGLAAMKFVSGEKIDAITTAHNHIWDWCAEGCPATIFPIRDLHMVNHNGIVSLAIVSHLATTDASRMADTMHLDRRGARGKLMQKLSQLIAIAVRLGDAVSAMAQKGLAHNDIKPENILVRDNEYFLADFDCVTQIPAQPFCRTPKYAAPEILSREGSSSKTDFYSLGRTLMSMTFTYAPFQNFSEEQMAVELLKSLMTFDELSSRERSRVERYLEFLRKLTAENPIERSFDKSLLN